MQTEGKFRAFRRPASSPVCWECGQNREDVVEYVLSRDNNYYRFCSPCCDKRLPGLRDRVLDDERVVLERIARLK